MTKELRAILPLLKARVTDIHALGFTLRIGAEYGSPTTIAIRAPMQKYDLRDGDILTLYTEVLLANPGSTSKQ